MHRKSENNGYFDLERLLKISPANFYENWIDIIA